MSVTLVEIRNQIGVTTDVIDDTMLQEALTMAEEYCTAFCARYGASGAGDAYDIAVKYMAQANVRYNLDVRGIKPESLSVGGLSMGTALSSTVDQLKALADSSLRTTVLSSNNRIDMYIRHIRSGKTVR